MSHKPYSETKHWHIPSLNNLELLHAKHQTQYFPKHTHERYAIGVIEKGALGFYYRGENVTASSGQISLCIPGEVHTGQPILDDGWTYRMFYFDSSFLVTVATEMVGKERKLPFFNSGVIDDDSIANKLLSLHIELENSGGACLEQETNLLNLLAIFIKRYADETPVVSRIGYETKAIRQVKDYLESCYTEDVSLETLSQLTGLSRYYLVRSFCKSVGIPPHAYLRQVRINHAKELIATGQSLSEVALNTGFTDQSHLNRWFKRFWGFTPGQYRNSVQDNLS